jgi:hypothetical protein
MHTRFWLVNLKRPLRRPRCKWEDSIIMHIRESGWEGVNCIHLAQGRDHLQGLVITVTNIQVP